MTYNTGNAVGSTDARDLYDNAVNLDTAVNSMSARWTDRLGISRPSWSGMVQYADIGPYAAGIEITGYNEIFLHEGEYYRAAASTTLPYTTTGSWSDDGVYFVSVGDAVLRQELETIADTVIGPYRNAVNCNQYGGLQLALSDSDTLGKVIIVTDNQSITDDVTVINRAIACEFSTGIITIASNKTLTINGPFSCGLFQCFDGAGTVTGLTTAHVEWFGLSSSGLTSAANAVADSYGTVLLSSTCDLYTGGIHIPQGVGIQGSSKAAKLVRHVKYDATDATTANMLVLYGNNLIANLTYDGNGASSTVYPGTASEDYTYYQDFYCAGDNITFDNCNFIDSPGSFITPSGKNIKVSNCNIQDYRDHFMYIGNATDGIANRWYGYLVENCVFTSARVGGSYTLRDPLKFKGNLGGVCISNNSFYLPDLAVAFVNVSAIYGAENFGDITIDGNIMYAPDTSAAYALWAYTGGHATRTIESIIFSNNVVTGNYGIWLGSRPTGQDAGQQEGALITSVVIDGNVFKGDNLWLFNGQDSVGVDGINFKVTNNYIDCTGSDAIRLIGNLTGEFLGNTFTSPTINFGIPTSSTYHWHASTVNTTFRGLIQFKNNTVLSGTYFITDLTGDASNPSACNIDILLDGNVFAGTGGTVSNRRWLSSSTTYPPAGTAYIGTNINAPNTGTPNNYMYYWAGTKKTIADQIVADNGDAAKTLYPGISETNQMWNTALTTSRAVTLDTLAAYAGAKFRIVRTAASTGAGTLNVGSGPLKALATGQWCEVMYNGTSWVLVAYGAL